MSDQMAILEASDLPPRPVVAFALADIVSRPMTRVRRAALAAPASSAATAARNAAAAVVARAEACRRAARLGARERSERPTAPLDGLDCLQRIGQRELGGVDAVKSIRLAQAHGRVALRRIGRSPE